MDKEKKRKFWDVYHWVPVLLFLIVAFQVYLAVFAFPNKSGLWMVYACTENDQCYTLRADVTSEESHTLVDRLYFNNGGHVDLDCVLEQDFCYESDSLQDWEITLIEKIEDKK